MSIQNNIPITILILAHHYSEKILSCLNSVNWASEVIVVVSGQASHGTWENLERMYANVRCVFLDTEIIDFSDVRNKAITYAKHDWVFFLDSDEVVSRHAESDLKEKITHDVQGMYVVRRDIFSGKELHWGELRNVEIPRIFRKDSGRYSGTVHERVHLDGKITHSNIILFHCAHDSVTRFLDKIILYSRIEAKARQKNQKEISAFEVVIWPLGKFLQNYFLRLGFLDGFRGLMYAGIMSIHSYAVRALLYEKK